MLKVCRCHWTKQLKAAGSGGSRIGMQRQRLAIAAITAHVIIAIANGNMPITKRYSAQKKWRGIHMNEYSDTQYICATVVLVGFLLFIYFIVKI
jgi:hypothetical protein